MGGEVYTEEFKLGGVYMPDKASKKSGQLLLTASASSMATGPAAASAATAAAIAMR